MIRGFSAEIPKFGITVILGQNSSGKTTIFRALIKCIRPKSGAIYLNGKDIEMIRIGELPNFLSYSPAELVDNIGLKVLDIVSATKRGSRWISEKEAIAALDYLGISGLSEKIFNELSTGQKRLALIARSVAAEAPIILLDEPTSSLDPTNKRKILDAIKKLSRKNAAVVIATHDLDLANESDWVIALKKGVALKSGTRKGVVTSKLLSELYESKIKI